MAVEPVPRKPWLLIVGGLLLAVLLAYTLFAGWLPARHQGRRLQRELEALYRREAELEARLAQLTQRAAAREQQLQALRAERDGLARRVADLERELSTARPGRR
jgi:septal ring factor EnvC (AmiA/AmiB activator)